MNKRYGIKELAQDIYKLLDPTNNQGRSRCYKCDRPTDKYMGFAKKYDICTNLNCDWLDR